METANVYLFVTLCEICLQTLSITLISKIRVAGLSRDGPNIAGPALMCKTECRLNASLICQICSAMILFLNYSESTSSAENTESTKYIRIR